ncbi:EamA family transporter [Pikeienuella piscinae]|uniref:EamA family transporter n=1 Tax=Pikeienuella piscinae TaxID=2748098 RepID=A0A7M3T7K5_9RHOB|nr:DMT family transporter [Pikeienuella piscinae]QIE57986.1 EamA family transporter [Pikeienuella piscinae]
MADWVGAIEGTETGAAVATALALTSALAHAVFGAIQKGRGVDPWLIRGAIDIWYFLMALPIALFVFPLPSLELAPVFFGAFVIHSCYKLLLAAAYARGAFTVVYPVVRGVSPLATVVFAGVVFGESFRLGQWGGVLLLSLAIMALAAVNLRRVTMGRETLLNALILALFTGLFTALYTTYDAWGIRLAENPFSFLFWFFVADGFFFPILAFILWRRRPSRPPLMPMLRLGFVGALIACVSFGAVMMATRLDKVGEAAALRETSVVFAAIIGWLFLKEEVGPLRAGLMALIGLGAMLVEFG